MEKAFLRAWLKVPNSTSHLRHYWDTMQCVEGSARWWYWGELWCGVTADLCNDIMICSESRREERRGETITPSTSIIRHSTNWSCSLDHRWRYSRVTVGANILKWKSIRHWPYVSVSRDTCDDNTCHDTTCHVSRDVMSHLLILQQSQYYIMCFHEMCIAHLDIVKNMHSAN